MPASSTSATITAIRSPSGGSTGSRYPNRRKLGLRYLALVGFYNLALLVAYNVPQSLMWTVGDPYPKDYVERSYFTNGLCGPGTPYECPTSEHRFVK